MKSASEIDFLVKVCGITQENDAWTAIEAGANALGFNFYERSPRYLTIPRAREIAESVRGRYLRVGVFVNPTQTEIANALEGVPLDVIQLHGDCCADPPRGVCVWRSITPNAVVRTTHPAEAYLLDTPSDGIGGSGRTFDWSLAASFPYRAILAGGLDGWNVAQAISKGRPWGVDACSRLEAKPGKKDNARVRHFVQAALAEARADRAAETIK